MPLYVGDKVELTLTEYGNVQSFKKVANDGTTEAANERLSDDTGLGDV